MSVYQHPSLARIEDTLDSPTVASSSTSLLLDHLLFLQSSSRFKLGRKELGMGPPLPPHNMGEWTGDSEDEEDAELEVVLGYGRGRRGRKGARGEDREGPRAKAGSSREGEDGSSRDIEEESKREGMERVLSVLLGKLKMEDEEDEGDEFEEEEERDSELDAALDDSAPSSSSSTMAGHPLGQTNSTSSFNLSSSSSRSASLLPPPTHLRLLVSGLLDLLLSPSLSPPPSHLPTPSAYNPTLPGSLRKINTILSPISSSPIPQLSLFPNTTSSATAAISSSHPLLNHSRGPEGGASKYPRGSIWDQVPRAAGPEGPWAFAGGQSQASRPNGGSSGDVATMPSFPSSYSVTIEVEGPRTKKAVGRAKVLFDAGILSSTPSSFFQPRSRPPGPSSPRLGHAAGLEPPSRKWWDIESGETVDGESLGRMMGFLKLFLEVSRMVAEGVGKGVVEKVENQRGRSLLRQMFGCGADGLWESDSEDSVCGSDDDGRDLSKDRQHASSSNLGSSSSIPTSSATFSSSSSSRSIPAIQNASYLYSSSLPPSRSPSPTPTPTPTRRQPSPRLPTRQHLARPSRAWYALLSSLLTQACIEGFGEFGWKGGEAVELVLGVGRGGVKRKGRAGVSGGAGAVIEEAGWELFGSRAEGGKRRQEFEKEMEERCEEFLTVDSHTRTLRDHFASLAAKYPLEPVERASLRFLESVASFVGVPELAQPPPPSTAPSSIPISSLLNPHPSHVPFPTYQQQPPTPPSNPRALLRRKGVERFFVPPRVVGLGGRKKKVVERGTKRGRAEGSVGAGAGASKEAKVADDEEMEEGGGGGVVVEDWPDPYGVEAGLRRE